MQKYHHLQKILQSRRSIFPHQFNNEAITEEELKIIFETAKYAPTHKRTQPWRFTAYRKSAFNQLNDSLESAMKSQMMVDIPQKLSKITDKLQMSQVAVLVATHFDPTAHLPEWEEIAATAMAVQNIWLMAAELRIGTYWSSPGFLVDSGIELGHTGHLQCLGIMYFGKIDDNIELNPSQRNNLSEYFNIID